jgi:hypothetical protein
MDIQLRNGWPVGIFFDSLTDCLIVKDINGVESFNTTGTD